jgi:excisionase family DNA binding protein
MGDPRSGCRKACQGRCPLGPLGHEERRTGTDRRTEPRGGRRITDLTTHPDQHLTVQAFATYLGVHRKTVVKWILAGTLPAYRFEGEWRLKTSEAAAFVAGARFQPASSDPL